MGTNFVSSWLTEDQKNSIEQQVQADIASGNVTPASSSTETLSQGNPKQEYVDQVIDDGKSVNGIPEWKEAWDNGIGSSDNNSLTDVETVEDSSKSIGEQFAEALEGGASAKAEESLDGGLPSPEELKNGDLSTSEPKVLTGDEAQEALKKYTRPRPDNITNLAEDEKDNASQEPQNLTGEAAKTAVSSVVSGVAAAGAAVGTMATNTVSEISSKFKDTELSKFLVNLGIVYSGDDMYTFGAKLKYLRTSAENIITQFKDAYPKLKESINDETFQLLGSDEISLIQPCRELIDGVYDKIEELITLAGLKEDENIEKDADPNGNLGDGQKFEQIPTGGGKHSSGGKPDSSLPDSATTPTEEVKIENPELITASVGALVFQTAITLFTTIGGDSVQSELNREYGLIGIEKVNDVFYYKIIDKTTGKIYYANANDISGSVGDIDKKVLHTKEKAMVLNSTDIGAEDNFVKLADAESYYLVTESQEVNGVNFATILDSTDGKSYYIPMSDSVETMNLSDITNAVTETTPTTSGTEGSVG